MQRKWTVLAVAMTSCVALVAGLALADEDSELHKVMEQVGAKNGVITKGVRSKVNFVKSQKDVVKSAKELAKLGKKAKPMHDALKNAKDVAKPADKWDELMDSFIKSSEDLSEAAGKSGATFEDAKASFGVVKKSCADCHAVFRKEDE